MGLAVPLPPAAAPGRWVLHVSMLPSAGRRRPWHRLGNAARLPRCRWKAGGHLGTRGRRQLSNASWYQRDTTEIHCLSGRPDLTRRMLSFAFRFPHRHRSRSHQFSSCHCTEEKPLWLKEICGTKTCGKGSRFLLGKSGTPPDGAEAKGAWTRFPGSGAGGKLHLGPQT